MELLGWLAAVRPDLLPEPVRAPFLNGFSRVPEVHFFFNHLDQRCRAFVHNRTWEALRDALKDDAPCALWRVHDGTDTGARDLATRYGVAYLPAVLVTYRGKVLGTWRSPTPSLLRPLLSPLC